MVGPAPWPHSDQQTGHDGAIIIVRSMTLVVAMRRPGRAIAARARAACSARLACHAASAVYPADGGTLTVGRHWLPIVATALTTMGVLVARQKRDAAPRLRQIQGGV